MDVKFKGNSIVGSVPLATTETPGIMQVGDGLEVKDGVVSAEGQKVLAGTGIEVTSQNGTATVALNSEVLSAVSEAVTETEADGKYLPINNPTETGVLTIHTDSVKDIDGELCFDVDTPLLSIRRVNGKVYMSHLGPTNDANRLRFGGLLSPENDSDAATKKYVDTLVGDIQSALDSILNS